MRNRMLGIALVVLWLVFALASPAFLGPRNLTMLTIELSITAVLALGMLPILLLGLIDLSAGSGVGLTGGLAAVLVFHQHWPAPLAMLLVTTLSVALWSLMGAAIVRQRMPAFIVTLGGLLVFKGVFWLVIRNATVPVVAGTSANALSVLTSYFLPQWLGFALIAAAVLAFALTRKQRNETSILQIIVVAQAGLLIAITLDGFRGIPLSVVLLCGVAFLLHFTTQRLPFGRYLYAIGDNEEAAWLTGVPLRRTVIIAFAIMGSVVALTGFLQTAYAGASTTTIGELMELDAIAACVIGGTSLRGGRGNVVSVLFGALIMTTLLNGMTLLAVAPELKLIARGAVLVFAVWLDVSAQDFTGMRRDAK